LPNNGLVTLFPKPVSFYMYLSDFVVGGFIGTVDNSISLGCEVHFANSKNTGNIELPVDQISLCPSYLAGFVGFVAESLNSSALQTYSLRFTNCENSGSIKGLDHSCGLFCTELQPPHLVSVINNCVVSGTIYGKNSTGFCTVATEANNVVSLVSFEATESRSLFWHNKDYRIATQYGISCATCTDLYNAINYRLPSQAYFYSNDRVDDILNHEAYVNGYEMYWSRQLHLVDYLTATVDYNGEEKNVSFAYNSLLSKNDLIQSCFSSSYCSVIDTDQQVACRSDRRICTDMNILLNYTSHPSESSSSSSISSIDIPIPSSSATEKSAVIIIDIKPIPILGINKTELILNISNLANVPADNVDLELVVDDEGMVVSVIVRVPSEETAEIFVESLNSILQDEDKKGEQCLVGVLCSAKRVYIDVPITSLSSAPIFIPSFLVLLFIV